jgi:RNA polymerase sigma-70 factor (ECF subfamily)
MRAATLPGLLLPAIRMDGSLRQTASTITPDLLARMAAGDENAFGQVYDQSSSLLFTLALRILGDREDASELLQDVYQEVWRKVVRYDAGRGSPMAWLITLTRSRAIDRLRARASRGFGATASIDETGAMELPDDRATQLEIQAGRELRASVAKALADLPDGQQEALELAYYEGLSHTEIAARLNVPLGTIKTRIKLGMNKLKIALRPWREMA